jgi:hypothetical protein
LEAALTLRSLPPFLPEGLRLQAGTLISPVAPERRVPVVRCLLAAPERRHDSSIDELELVSLASSPSGGERVMNTIVTYSGPALTPQMSDNLEGIAIVPVDDRERQQLTDL